LWVENKECLIPVTLFAPEPRKPLAINLNTASVYDLASFPGMSNKRAAQVMAARDQQGYFRTVAEAQSHGFRP
jgi:DNA uptake protein ComE-like DNA-binding protein